MTFEEFMLELGKEWPTPLLCFVLLIGLSMFLLRMKTKMTEFKDADGKKIQDQLRELLEKYGNKPERRNLVYCTSTKPLDIIESI